MEYLNFYGDSVPEYTITAGDTYTNVVCNGSKDLDSTGKVMYLKATAPDSTRRTWLLNDPDSPNNFAASVKTEIAEEYLVPGTSFKLFENIADNIVVAYSEIDCAASSEYQLVFFANNQDSTYPGFFDGALDGSIRTIRSKSPQAESYQVVRLNSGTFKTGKDNQFSSADSSTEFTETGCFNRPSG